MYKCTVLVMMLIGTIALVAWARLSSTAQRDGPRIQAMGLDDSRNVVGGTGCNPTTTSPKKYCMTGTDMWICPDSNCPANKCHSDCSYLPGDELSSGGANNMKADTLGCDQRNPASTYFIQWCIDVGGGGSGCSCQGAVIGGPQPCNNRLHTQAIGC